MQPMWLPLLEAGMIETYAAAAEVAAANCRPIRPAIWAVEEWRTAQLAALSALRTVSAEEADAVVAFVRPLIRAAALCAAHAVGVLPEDMGRGLWDLASSLKWEGRTIALPTEKGGRRVKARLSGLSGPEIWGYLDQAGVSRSCAVRILAAITQDVYNKGGCGPFVGDWAAVAQAQADFAAHEGYQTLVARDAGQQAPWRS